MTDDVTWPRKVLWGSAVGYPSDSLASCFIKPIQSPSCLCLALSVPIYLKFCDFEQIVGRTDRQTDRRSATRHLSDTSVLWPIGGKPAIMRARCWCLALCQALFISTLTLPSNWTEPSIISSFRRASESVIYKILLDSPNKQFAWSDPYLASEDMCFRPHSSPTSSICLPPQVSSILFSTRGQAVAKIADRTAS